MSRRPDRKLLSELEKRGVPYRQDELLARHTTLGIGGPTPLYLHPRDRDALLACLELLRGAQWPFKLLGAGSNLLIEDRPLNFAVVSLRQLTGEPHWEPEAVTAEAGLLLPGLARSAAERGLAGLDFAIGIPGSIGGGVCMNAGAMECAIDQVVESVEFARLEPDGVGSYWRLPEFGYRRSDVGEQEVVLRARFGLRPADPEELLERQEQYILRRRRSQPTASRSAGCMFRNPPGESAGRLIDRLGLKGERRGAAEVSMLHGNYVLNRGGASFDEVLGLIESVAERVAAHGGIKLEREVVVWRARPTGTG